jgi:hypothetical protein
MTGIVIMVIGFSFFIVGIIIYSNSNKKIKAVDNETELKKVVDNGNELNKVIEMAIADGVLTLNEKKLIKQITTEKELDYNEIIKNVEKQISELKIDSETELIDYNEKNGYDFEKFIVQKFNKKYFHIKEWAGDKYVNGIYADTTPQPDIQLEFSFKQETGDFSVECKWRQKLYKNGVEFATTEQLKRYRSFEKKQKNPVFIAIGIGGKAISPKQLYIIPLQEIDNNFIPIKELKKYEKKVNSDFFFDNEKKELK